MAALNHATHGICPATSQGTLTSSRDHMQQIHAHEAVRQSKTEAKAIINGLAKQQETQRALAKQLIRAKADHQVLLIDGKEVRLHKLASAVAA